MAPRLRPVRSALLAAVVAGGAQVAAPPARAADPAPVTYVTVLGGGDYIGQAAHHLFHSGNATIHVSGTASKLSVDVTSQTSGADVHIELYAPDGQVLAPGTYEDVRGYANREPGHAAMRVSGEGRGCDAYRSRFVVDDVAVGTDGVVNRFSGTYEHHCFSDDPAVIGQIVVNQPAATVATYGDQVRFPAIYPDDWTRDATVWLHNRGDAATAPGAASVTGADSAAFSVVSNGCATLAAGAECAVRVRFAPRAARTYSAALAIGGRTIPLTGRGIPGYTSLHLRSQRGDPVGGGGWYDYTPATASFELRGGRNDVWLRLYSGDQWWILDLEAPAGETLAPGTYAPAARASFTDGAGLDVGGLGRGCNTLTGSFTVHEIGFHPVDGMVDRFSASFEQHCNGVEPALKGWIAWRATDPNLPTDLAIPPVTDLRAAADGLHATISWQLPTDGHTVTVRRTPGTTRASLPSDGDDVFTGRATTVTDGPLRPGATYTYTVFASDDDGDTSAGRAVTVRGSVLRIGRSTPAVTYGSAMTLRVRLLDAPTLAGRAGRAVDVYIRRPGGGWTLRTTLTTGSDGVADWRVAPRRTYEYQAVFRGAGPALGATSPVTTVAVRTRVTATLSRTSVARGGAVTVRGTVAPAKPGQRVELQRWLDGAWRPVAAGTLTADSAYAITFRPATAGTWTLRVHKAADAAHAAGAGPSRTLSVT